jgi:GNAT superfamily N-acetyltransferase
MMASRSPAARGVGSALLDAAAQLASATGRQRLRLDAWRTNFALHDYYRRNGFKHVRTVDLAHRGSGALFERPVCDKPAV